MDNSDSIIFLLDKNGRKRNMTKAISDISYDNDYKYWKIIFTNTPEKTYRYKPENVQIVNNCLKDKASSTVFDYLIQMAQFSDIKNDEGQNLLVKNLERTRFINEESVLARYLNPSIHNAKVNIYNSLIFPFGCNNSQYKAVKAALNSQISIIQGPPGTGKTQTILNIIASLLFNKKTVLVVSNNNAATANVYEKLKSDKYQLDFLCATLGKRENFESFVDNQQTQYPECLEEWKKKVPVPQSIIDQDVKNLEEYFSKQERVAKIRAELAELETEITYFNQNNAQEKYGIKKLQRISAERILEVLQKYQFQYSEKDKIGFLSKLILFLGYGVGSFKFWKTDEEKALFTLKSVFYEVKTKELVKELNELSLELQNINPNIVYEKCLNNLQCFVAEKYSEKKERPYFANERAIISNLEKFISEYPIILSTTFSSRATVGNNKEFLFDYVIMDEASQVDIVTGSLALSCAKNAVIVGDKMQLPNVIEEAKIEPINEIFTQAKILEGYNFTNSFLSSIEKILPETSQTLLKEHYRCHPKIINFCNQQFYGGQLFVMTEDKCEHNVLEAIKTTPGNFCSDHYNQRQIDIIKQEILPRYSQDEINNLGIIAPYNNQTNAIQSQIEGVDTATVHKYQGREKDNIIISTVDNQISNFADNANMLNVAISRAKKKLAVIISGNEQPDNSNLMALIKYIQYNNFNIEESKVNSIFDFLYSRVSAEKFNFLRATGKISKFDSENAMNAILSNLIKKTEYSRFNFVFEMPLRDVVSQKFAMTLPDDLSSYANHSCSHVDFIVFNRVTKEILFGIEVDGYTYHKKGTKQFERDIKKNRIFEIIGLPLLRFSTKGSEEESIIIEQLNKYI